MYSVRLAPLAACMVLLIACEDQTGPNIPPTAAFAALCGPYSCTFTNSSTDADGAIAAYAWDFDDESEKATTRDAQHTYAAPGGDFTVTLTVTDDEGAVAQASVPVQLRINSLPAAAFTASCQGLTCQFTDQSTDYEGSVATRRWIFDDGSEATTPNPSHTYGTFGDHTVTLVVTDPVGGTGRTTHNVSVMRGLNTLPQATIAATCSVLTCDLVANAFDPDGAITGYDWDFGDGTHGTGASPRHAYEAAGSYFIVLTATDDSGSTALASTPVTLPAPEQFTIEFSAECDGTVCRFTSNAAGLIINWDFGDGEVSSDANPTHVYDVTEPTTFTVTLAAWDFDLFYYSRTLDVTVAP